jgi:hypothetical protein
MQRKTFLPVCLGLFAGVAMFGHHSLTAEYDQSKPITLSGTFTQLDLSEREECGRRRG